MARVGTITVTVRRPNVCPGCGRCRDCGQPAPPQPLPTPVYPQPMPPAYPQSPFRDPMPWETTRITCGG